MLGVGACCGFLLYRLAPDVEEKPLYEDEAIAGLIGMRPLDEVLETVLLDRGGAPLHFVVAHLAISIDASAEALRWLSVLAALAAVPLCFDVARRLGGLAAGVVAAAVAASSTALAIYGSFGRMYALFVLVAALFCDLFVRALQVRSRGAVAAAAFAGWLLPAVHPYGAIPAVIGLVIGAAIWRRGRDLRAAAAVAVAALAAIPFLLADLRLADRAAVSSEGDALASPGEAWTELVAAMSSFAGGDGLPLAFFTALALAGLAVLLRREPAFGALAAAIVLPPLLFVLVRSDAAPDLSPRHLFYGLPIWAAAIGVAAARMPLPAALLVAVIALTSPASDLRDPRQFEFATIAPGERRSIRADERDVLLPYASVFLASLPDVRHALALPHAPGEEIVSALEHADEPIGTVHVAVPRVGQSTTWTVVPLDGPFDRAGAIAAAADFLTMAPPAVPQWWLEWIQPGLCEALRELDRRCP
jgi:Dolichyl-phosphate-mannose-protein mannosyltransferase